MENLNEVNLSRRNFVKGRSLLAALSCCCCRACREAI